MKVIYGLGKLPKNFSRPFVTLGIFDGVHLGHRYILTAMLKEAYSANKKTACITFYPHPEKILNSKNIFIHLISLEDRINLLKSLGIDICIVINFNRRFLRITAENFIRLLAEKINPEKIFVGKNFTFGYGGSGNISLLKRLAPKYGFRLKVILPFQLGGRVVSSTRIRSFIKEGRLDLAKKFLGRNVSVSGKVMKGKQFGRKLGYHTANVDAEHEIIPPPGIYAVKVKLENKYYGGAAYFGTSPTLHLGYRLPRLEVYILNFRKNIYGKKIEVELIKKIRREKEFPSLEKLAIQIKKDVIEADSILSRLN